MQIKVIAKIGNTIHPRLGLLAAGEEYTIDESEFGDEIFTKQEPGVRSQEPAAEEPETRGVIPQSEIRNSKSKNKEA